MIAALLAVLAGSAAAYEFGYVNSRADMYIERIRALDALLRDDPADAVLACRELERDWERDAATIHALLIHDYAEAIGGSIAKMRVHLERHNADMYFAESTDAKKGLASIKGSEYPLLENIL